MSCVNPLLAVDHGVWEGKHHIEIISGRKLVGEPLSEIREAYGKRLMFLPCGHCVACAKDYARTWQGRIMCESEYHQKSCFLTLTYRENPPKFPSKDHLRSFIKDVRNNYGKGIKFFGCGEKGELNERSHYHLILFGVDFSHDQPVKKTLDGFIYQSKELDKLWKYGFASVGSLTLESAGYASRYCDKKKITGLDDGEFVIMSRGLGRQYFQDHYKEIFDSDFIYFKGNKFKLPRYFLKLALNKDDFYLRCLAEDYQDRKRLVAQSFRYNQRKSMSEDAACFDMKNILENNKKNKEVIRDV